MPCKPNIVAIDQDVLVEDFKTMDQMDWSKLKVIGEEKKAAFKDKKFVNVVGGG